MLQSMPLHLDGLQLFIVLLAVNWLLVLVSQPAGQPRVEDFQLDLHGLKPGR